MIVVAVLATAMLALTGPAATAHSAMTAAFLCAIGWATSRFTYDLAVQGARGAVGYLLFPAAGIAVADWTVPVAAAVAVLAVELGRGAQAHKAAFNTASAALAAAVAVLALHAVGGQGLVVSESLQFGPVVVLLLTSRLINNLALAGVLTIAQGQPFWRALRAITGRAIVDDILVSPLVGVLAYAVVAWGFVPTLATSASMIWVHRLYQTNIALQTQSRELLEIMVSAIEARDPYTSGHSRRVSQLAVNIARAVGLSEREVARIGVAGLLHDVGKIHEKYAVILRKPDRLTAEEWALMKEHPADGEALVSKVSSLHDILPGVRNHHEKWDGSGYPDGLRGHEIPVMARVLAFADTIDAMMSTRPYRRGLSAEEVRAEIVKWAGKQFDPDMATQLLASPHWTTLFEPASADNARYGLRLVEEQKQVAG